MSNELAIQSHTKVVSYFPTDSDWKQMLSFGETALRSGLLPSGIKTKEAAAIVALKARELDMPFMVGLAHIHVINGKPTLSAELMVSLARRNLPGLVINILQSDNVKCTIEFLRPEKGSKPFQISWTIEDAKTAGLLSNPTWSKYPSAMLYSRAVSAGLRRICPEALMGVSYTPEEMGANVDGEGNVIETTGKVINPSAPVSPITPVSGEVSQAMLARLFTIIDQAGVTKEQAKEEMFNRYGILSSKDLNRDQYTELCDFFTQLVAAGNNTTVFPNAALK